MSPTAIDHVILSIRILENKLSDRLGPVMEGSDQRFTQVIHERSRRVFRYGHPNAAGFIISLDIVGSKK